MSPKWIPVWIGLILVIVVPLLLILKYKGYFVFICVIGGALAAFIVSAIDLSYTRIFLGGDTAYFLFINTIIGAVLGAIVSWRVRK